ncbi:MAG: magnesium chelatase family protein [Rhodothermales bacterium]|jgi:magnesium chelatase family protein
MLAKTYSAALRGVEPFTVEIEINASEQGERCAVVMVGLPDAAVRESRERVHSALTSSGYMHPFGTTTVNLAPADVKKEGSHFDLPIAIGMMSAINQLGNANLNHSMIVGELALDGGVRPLRGALALALHAREAGISTLIVPAANAAEAAMVSGINVYGVAHLTDAVRHLKGESPLSPTVVDLRAYFAKGIDDVPDFADIKGQALARRAVEVAAAGGHNILLIGPPGTGKSMIAKRIPGILPHMTLDEALSTTKLHSIAGKLENDVPLLTLRPFRSPHHTISDAGLLGGQSNPQPGEVSLAHNGVLFLDEMPEFKRNVLEVLRQPLEDGAVTISRAAGSFTFPARFQLVAAMNPCPCGHHGSTVRQCRCSSPQIQRYRSRLSGPLLDRIDMHIEVGTLSEQELMSRPTGETSEVMRERVKRCREVQVRRFADSATNCNAQMSSSELQENCQLDPNGEQVLRIAINELNLSARAYDRILRVARTLADLESSKAITLGHVSEAIQYRSLDRQLW